MHCAGSALVLPAQVGPCQSCKSWDISASSCNKIHSCACSCCSRGCNVVWLRQYRPLTVATTKRWLQAVLHIKFSQDHATSQSWQHALNLKRSFWSSRTAHFGEGSFQCSHIAGKCNEAMDRRSGLVLISYGIKNSRSSPWLQEHPNPGSFAGNM